jgi:hypothetical protein
VLIYRPAGDGYEPEQIIAERRARALRTAGRPDHRRRRAQL